MRLRSNCPLHRCRRGRLALRGCAQHDECNQKCEKTSGAEAELDEEIRILQAGGERQLCVAVQRMLLRSSRWWSSSLRCKQHKHGSRPKLLNGSFTKDLRCHINPQPPRCTHREEEETKEEEQRRRAASRQLGQPAPGDRNLRGFQLSVFRDCW